MPARRLAGQLRRARCANARIILQHGQIRNGIRFYSILSGELTIRLVFIRAFALVPILVLLISYLVCHMAFPSSSHVAFDRQVSVQRFQPEHVWYGWLRCR